MFFNILVVTNLNQSCNSLCYHPLQTDDELELVNEVIFLHVNHSHESMAIDCPHIISMVTLLYKIFSLFWSCSIS